MSSSSQHIIAQGKQYVNTYKLNNQDSHIKGIVHPKIIITPHHVIPNLFDFLSAVECGRYFEECL